MNKGMKKTPIFSKDVLLLYKEENKGWKYIKNLSDTKQLSTLIIEDSDFYNFLIREIKRGNRKFKTIFFMDLKILKALKTSFEKANFSVVIFEHESRLFSIEIKHPSIKNKRLIFKDLFNFFRDKKFYNLQEANERLIMLFSIVEKNFDININNNRILTTTSISWRYFLKNLKKTKPEIDIKKLNFCEDTFIRKSYFGGRTEIYQFYGESNKEKEIFYFDINSLFPYIMKNYKVPYGKPKFIQKVNKDFLLVNDEDTVAFVDILLYYEGPQLPILPFREEKKGLGNIYPKGYIRGVFYSEEIKFAVDNGYKIIDTFKGYSFKTACLFDTFVDKVYKLRTETDDKVYRNFYKDLANGLYGRWALSIADKLSIKDKFLGVVIKNYNVAISSAISSLARIYTYKLLRNYQKDLLYFDTDGAFLSLEKTQEIKSSLEIGEFRLVAKIQKVLFISPKVYLFKDIDNHFQFTFRGITSEDYILDDENGDYYFSLFYKILKKSIISKNKYSYLFNFNLKRKEFPFKEVEIPFEFFHKRKVIFLDKSLITSPWTLGNKDKKHSEGKE